MYLHLGSRKGAWLLRSLGFAGVLAPGLAGAAVIDLFTASLQAVELTAPSGNVTRVPDVDLQGSLFDTRGMSVSYGVQRLAVTAGLLDYQVSPPATGFVGNERGYFDLSYASADPVNLLGGGDSAIRLQFLNFTSSAPYSFSLILSDGSHRTSYGIRLTGDALAGGFVDVPFSAFSQVNLSAVTAVTLSAARLPVGTSFQLAGITTVPEAEVLACLAPAVALGLRRRRPQA